ncbi:MAG TPA: patatin-like phospholipase family protein [Flavobacterium sp.]|jgi:hypothetical protein
METVSVFLRSLWLYIAGILSVAAIYCLLTGIEQGIDVVIQSGENFGAGFFMVLCTLLWAFILWYSSRILSYIKQQRDADLQKVNRITTQMHRHVPRMIAFNCFVAVQAAIVSLPSTTDINGRWLFLFVVLHNILYFALSSFFAYRNKHSGILSLLLLVIYGGIVVATVGNIAETNLHDGSERHTFWVWPILSFLMLIEILMVRFFIWRRQRIDRRRNEKITEVKSRLWMAKVMDWLLFRDDFRNAERPWFRIFNIIGAVALLIYLSGIFFIGVSREMGALAFVLLAIGVLIGLTNLVTGLNIKFGINFFLFLIVIAFIIRFFYDPYPVRTIESEKPFSYGARPVTRQYLDRWFSHRLEKMESDSASADDKNFDVYIVLSNGGASRAGHWSSSVLSHLQDVSYQKDSTNSFKDHVLCLAGASGGSVGNTAFYSLLKAEKEDLVRGDEFTAYSTDFFNRDFLTFTLGRMLGPDIVQHLIPFKVIDNRADVLERTLRESESNVIRKDLRLDEFRSYYDRPYHEMNDVSGELPILFINTTQVDNGRPGVISSVRMNDSVRFASQRTDLLGLIDSINARSAKGHKRNMRINGKITQVDYGTTDIRYSTAAILSSRFPYVSPAGKVYDRYFVDGGYFDNSGAGTVLEFLQELRQYLDEMPEVQRNRFAFHILHMNNSEVIETPAEDVHPLTNDLAAPLLTLVGIQGSSTNISDGVLRQYYLREFNGDTSNAYIKYNLYDMQYAGKKSEEGYPMSWVISEYHFARMNKALVREVKKNNYKLNN